MPYDIRDTMIEAIQFAKSSEGPYWSRDDVTDYGQDTPPEYLATTALSVIDKHLANEPRTKAETALIEFAEGKAREMRDKGFLLASDVAIPSGILWAFVEELGK